MVKKSVKPTTKRSKAWMIVLFGALTAIFVFLAIQSTFFFAPPCSTFACFQENMQECKKVSYVNEQNEATWRYEILSKETNACIVQVTLLQPKEGDLGLEKLSGFSMECNFPRGVTAYPERDLDRCNGRLREELQAIIIRKLHTHIIENIGQIDEELSEFS